VLEPAPKDAVLWVTAVGLGTLLFLVGADFCLTATHRSPIGSWVTQWARRYPLFAIALALVAGGMIGHFFFATEPPR
jgi:hypothetical protein